MVKCRDTGATLNLKDFAPPPRDRDRSGVVYKIECRANGRVYIGQTVSFDDRMRSHSGQLINNKHDNKLLQADCAEHGIESFSVTLLKENVPQDMLVAVEILYIVLLQGKLGKDRVYNGTSRLPKKFVEAVMCIRHYPEILEEIVSDQEILD